MANGEAKIRRTLHFKFVLTGASEQMIAMMKSAAPLYQMFGDAQVRLLQNVDDPSRFLQEIEYDAPESLELNRQQIARRGSNFQLERSLRCKMGNDAVSEHMSVIGFFRSII